MPDRSVARIVIAPDGFKGTATAADAAEALAAGWRERRPGDEIVLRPMADGGEGTVAAFAAAVPGSTRMPVQVTGPDGAVVEASWLLLPPSGGAPGGTGVVELASTSGIELLGDRRLPWDAHTRGFGATIAAALDHGVDALVLGIGSSASTDGGAGMLAELGAVIAGASGAPVADGARGLADIREVRLEGLRPVPRGGVTVLTDVRNPLVGATGAAAVYGPQKGLGPDEIAEVDAALAAYAGLLPADPETPGAGAAGGVGFALLAWGARLVPGADAVADLVGLVGALADADAVITGEGSFDAQTASGKVPSLVATAAHAAGARAILVAGRIAGGADASGFVRAVSLAELAGSPEAAMGDPLRWLREAGRSLAADS
ncbi:glycerate kinase [Homoserinibacter sp. GY 40078]|uniref:glycerate kinase n=1 Tax=Homoserinibacter sp. GY 40078 TaxID=2603275 RepID=UPI0011C71D85|nr:glycerate kinase [Homoserinibacter sp. GY 40078]TXK18664.1 glycerate kinase [Homoserinibacter sp. GY 40078]